MPKGCMTTEACRKKTAVTVIVQLEFETCFKHASACEPLT